MYIIEEVRFLPKAIGIRWNHSESIYYYAVGNYPYSLADWDRFRPWDAPESRKEQIFIRAKIDYRICIQHNYSFFAPADRRAKNSQRYSEKWIEAITRLSSDELLAVPQTTLYVPGVRAIPGEDRPSLRHC